MDEERNNKRWYENKDIGKPNDPTIGAPYMRGRRWRIDPSYFSGTSYKRGLNPKIVTPVKEEHPIMEYRSFFKYLKSK